MKNTLDLLCQNPDGLNSMKLMPPLLIMTAPALVVALLTSISYSILPSPLPLENMNKSFLCLPLMACCVSSGHAADSFDFQHLREYQKLTCQYSQERNLSKAAETDAQLRQLLPKIIPNIIKDLPSISQHRQTLLSIYLRKLPDEDYLNVAECLIQYVNFNNSEQVQFLENTLFEPFESSRDNFFAMNWRNARVRQLCKQLQERIDPKNPIHGKMTAILNGEEFKNMMQEAFRGDFRIPMRLPHRDDEPQFQKWGASEKDQMAAIKNLREEWDKACKALLDMKGKENVDQVAQAWKKATGAAEKVMNLLPPPQKTPDTILGCIFIRIFSRNVEIWPRQDKNLIPRIKKYYTSS